VPAGADGYPDAGTGPTRPAGMKIPVPGSAAADSSYQVTTAGWQVDLADRHRALIEKLFAQHGGALHAFFYRRVRTKQEVADLAQEVYLRMLRIPDADAIRSPEAYLFTVAGNLVKEQAVLEARRSAGVDVQDEAIAGQLAELPRFEAEIDSGARIERLREVLAQLPPKCRAAVVLQYQHGLSYQEIGERLGVSHHMVKKYLTQALAHCRRRMSRLG